MVYVDRAPKIVESCNPGLENMEYGESKKNKALQFKLVH